MVHVLYSWGRDSSSNFDVVMFLANKLPRRVGLDGPSDLPSGFFQPGPALPSVILQRVPSTMHPN